jgi:hypothetical protein
LIRHAKSEIKVMDSLKSIEKEIAEKEAKKAHLKIAVESINKEDYAGYLRREVESDIETLQVYREIRQHIANKAIDAQNNYFHFEKIFFNDLERVVISKKMAAGMKAALLLGKR